MCSSSSTVVHVYCLTSVCWPRALRARVRPCTGCRRVAAGTCFLRARSSRARAAVAGAATPPSRGLIKLLIRESNKVIESSADVENSDVHHTPHVSASPSPSPTDGPLFGLWSDALSPSAGPAPVIQFDPGT